jgi:hypothetical protein
MAGSFKKERKKVNHGSEDPREGEGLRRVVGVREPQGRAGGCGRPGKGEHMRQDTGTYVEATEETFSEFADKWLKNRVGIKGSTLQNYESYLKVHVQPVLGAVKVKDIRPSTIQDLIAKLCQKKASGAERLLSANTVGKIITMLKTTFKAAVKDRVIHVNPALDAELPKVVKKKVQPPDKKDLIAILQRATPEMKTLFLLDAMTGLRRGEVLTLQWRDIDWLNSKALIQRALCKSESDGRSSQIPVGPEFDKGRRIQASRPFAGSPRSAPHSSKQLDRTAGQRQLHFHPRRNLH